VSFTLDLAGSNPARDIKTSFEALVTLAQLVERMAFNHMVMGSIPICDIFPYSLVVVTPGFHPGGPGSIPGMGNTYMVL
jgi:hypothetical protein